jgi:crotonobetainyl-CoA:carnitine CoA-transferase CaiB-like acyl-CoA transferase
MHLAARLAMGSEGTALERGVESLNGGYPCYGAYRCADGKYLAVGALEPKFFQGVCEALGRPDLYEGAYDTGEGGKKVRAQLEAVFAGKPRDAWVELFRTRDVCVEPVWEGDEVLKDPQLRARGMFIEDGGVTHLATPLHFGPVPLRPPPALGEHTAQVLG